MNTKPFTSGLSENAVVITRVADRQWHALDDDLVVGCGYAEHRPDGRLFVSIDAWHDATFDRLAVRCTSKGVSLSRPVIRARGGLDRRPNISRR